ncbi:NAD(P)-dependent oxidoreductase [Pseudomonas sp. NPDC090233]|uniref:NAD(P)-dependent oxidoreductase n=1 Tax=Pseudomonas sp. NPDC090233 TaxID=3364479 RepID=UPI00383B5A85
MKNAETPVFKLVLFGAENSLGSALIAEMLSRQHEVTAVVDDLNRHAPRPGLHFKIGGLGDADQAEQSAAGGSAVVALLSGELAGQGQMAEALVAGLSRTTIRRVLLVGDFDVLDAPGKHTDEERESVDRVVDVLQRSALHWTVINAPAALADLERVAAGMADMLELDLHRGEHLNFR